jgi:MoaA/NifB/PqqE/SkfB family radical SAM enzyme
MMTTQHWWVAEAPVTLSWDLWYACNYRCAYCWWEMDNLWDKLAAQHRVLPPQEWLAVWDRIHAGCGSVRIDLLGGEPLIYPRCDELLEGLSRRHTLQITTNLALPLDRLDALLGKLSPQRVHFNASFHPGCTSLPDFLERVLRLKRAGFVPGVAVVTWPPFLERLPAYYEEFESRGIPFYPMTFQGRWNGRQYPDAFSPEEKALIESLMNQRPLQAQEVRYRLDAFGRKPMGNLFDPGFRLYAAPQPCSYENCSCMEYKFLDEVLHAGRASGTVSGKPLLENG